ncbi:MAG: N-acetyltransferase [Lentimicrobium sp.]|jgi:predicted GNAT family acetyltransferase|uniref:Predicted acetyltransferase, GNAT superfamily n=1 Tax=Lentimicrobium saccharophilum TaxID=1678841 RepID=A0A0S7C7Z4_9BACT|nr:MULTISPECIES: GNAT family N-acetyltransferase [Lentimicrobium]MCO5256967.1 N-acetyltransferase [Lentimicrobium sp.]MCO5264102.1 N-acetyltransferase [Lentimicrobium sp.]GAP45247.1 predicted acetyltransferase, GNAT superfamily [Lentimicrobium saccharophilum]
MKSTIIDTGEKFILNHEGMESYLAYRRRGEVLDFYSAYVPGSLRGKGLASDLILHGMHYAVMNGLRVRPSHPAVLRFLEINREWEYLTVYSLN